MAYRQLTEKELRQLSRNLIGYFDNKDKYPQLVKIINKYFPNANSVLISISSEYDDEGYDNRVSSISVYDVNDIECPLSKTDRQKFNNEFEGISLGRGLDRTDDPIDDIVLYFNKELPVLFLKE